MEPKIHTPRPDGTLPWEDLKESDTLRVPPEMTRRELDDLCREQTLLLRRRFVIKNTQPLCAFRLADRFLPHYLRDDLEPVAVKHKRPWHALKPNTSMTVAKGDYHHPYVVENRATIKKHGFSVFKESNGDFLIYRPDQPHYPR